MQVQILSRSETAAVDQAGTLRPVLEVVYQTRFTPPRLLRIPLAEASDERIAQEIRADLERAQQAPPSTLEL